MTNISVYQDGSEFYCKVPNVMGTVIVRFPDKVMDFDTVAAALARNWFIGWCSEHNFLAIDDSEGYVWERQQQGF